MIPHTSPLATLAFSNFGDLLKFLRRRERLTQLELSIAVGYSESQISRLENNQRLPDRAALQALFVPALHLEHETELVTRLIELAESARIEDAPAPGLAPYKGLLFFDESDAEWFFGRDALTAHLAEHINTLIGKRDGRLLAIVGASGSGKSSVVRAGLAVALKHAGWNVRVGTPTAQPLKMMDANWMRADAPTLLIVDQFEEVFTLCRDETARAAFIENLLALADDPLKPVAVTLALRADFYSHCAQYPQLRQAIAAHQEYIGQMTPVELRRAIEEPAQRGGWEFETGLVEILLRDIGADSARDQEPGALPLLSHALLATWEHRRGRVMTLEGYRASGGVRGAIAQTAESVFTDQFNRAQQEFARDIFLRLTELGEGTEDTRRRATLTELVPHAEQAAQLRAVLNTLADARLVSLGEDSVEVAHEALIREWARLREWLNENREALRLHRRLTDAAQSWERLKRDPGELYRGARLAQALEWTRGDALELNHLECEFLGASLEMVRREETEREAQRQRELQAAQQLAETQTRAAKQLRRRAYFLASAFALAIVFAFIALFFGEQARASAVSAQVNARTAEQERRVAFARELSASAINNLDIDPERSVLLALQAVAATYSIDQTVTFEAEDALHRAVPAARAPFVFRGHSARIYRVASSPDGARIATVSFDKQFKVWDSVTGKELLTAPTLLINAPWTSKPWFSRDGTRALNLNLGADDASRVNVETWDVISGKIIATVALPVPAKTTTWNATSPDGTRMVFGHFDKTATVWDLTTGNLLLTLRGHTSYVQDVAFSPDGTRIATASDDRTAKIWDAQTGNLLLTLAGHSLLIQSLAFSPDGTRLATASSDGTAKVWDTRTGRELLTFSGHTNFVYGIAFSPDGTRIATGGLDRKAFVWDATSGKVLFTLLGHSDAVFSVAFSPDGKRLVTAGRDSTAQVWELQPTRELLTLSAAPIWGFSMPRDGKQIAAAHRGGAVDVWDTATGKLLTTLPRKILETSKSNLGVNDIAYSPDGSRLVRVNDDWTAQVWDVVAGKPLFDLVGHQDYLVRVAYSPDGKQIATTSNDHTAKIWDAATGKEIFTLPDHPNEVDAVAYSPEGNLIVTGCQCPLRFWDAQTGKLQFTLDAHANTIFGIAFSPDGKRFATASRDGTAKVWDLATRAELFKLTGHTSTVFAVTFSHDGTRLATASYDATSKIWSATTGKELLTLYGHTNGADGVAFMPDDTRLITTSEDGTVRFYLLRIEELIALAKSRVARALTKEECAKYLHAEQCPTDSRTNP
ncbi:MAG: helix-turn-helix domain-containing protein [Chloroflexi bacterium]|nr:helix-turn-helix domain-containing protein [Chloroflexota bacterium]